MAKSFNALLNRMSPEARARVNKKAGTLIAEMPLQELKVAREIAQEKLAEEIGVKQSAAEVNE
jgi:hypothetical protein